MFNGQQTAFLAVTIETHAVEMSIHVHANIRLLWQNPLLIAQLILPGHKILTRAAGRSMVARPCQLIPGNRSKYNQGDVQDSRTGLFCLCKCFIIFNTIRFSLHDASPIYKGKNRVIVL